jgi:hypothetical protein
MAQMAQGQQASKGMMGAQTPMGQQGGMMAGQLGMAQAGMAQAQGNNQKGMMQNEQSRAELTKQMGQAGAVRGSWKDAQGGGAGGGVAGMVGGFGHGDSPYGQGGLAGIAQQGGLMGQNAGAPGGGMAAAQQALMGQGQLTPEQQEAQRKKAQALGVV